MLRTHTYARYFKWSIKFSYKVCPFHTKLRSLILINQLVVLDDEKYRIFFGSNSRFQSPIS